MYYYYVPQAYSYVHYYPVPYTRQQFETYQQAQPSPEQKPYLTTWPYSNVYYGNYYES
ncbi:MULTISPECIES: hypothetical protein [Bacillus]|uniref:hypothetical protein n=1 Tax=Bacillus TaxID=1386 RepID=UPI0001A1577D|nr:MULTISPECIES: hypothetical protein [Bacillus]AIK35932.1 hypothetical protein DJ92_1225 [Bacillus pseudomycoides]AJI15722.1 hypothetical protein BG07_3711 [Bacillus pseudomycoides]EEM04193.1 hypothetical protein bmyco0002_33560 [Bacillus pseudomycoides]KFN17100.1 hypothetical protein DJ94_274 [Bacillus pseudomycoides]MCR8857153.1 hypothetical protein [Bacillus pseudomycoides]